MPFPSQANLIKPTCYKSKVSVNPQHSLSLTYIAVGWNITLPSHHLKDII